MKTKPKAKPLTPAMQHVIDRMRDGWALGNSVGGALGPWLQRNGVGRGGPTETVRQGTFFALVDRGLIKLTRDGYPSQEYGLTPAKAKRVAK